MTAPNYFCECGAQVLTERFDVMDSDRPGVVAHVTQGRCIVCLKVMSFAE
jgi:hypothetical protein